MYVKEIYLKTNMHFVILKKKKKKERQEQVCSLPSLAEFDLTMLGECHSARSFTAM